MLHLFKCSVSFLGSGPLSEGFGHRRPSFYFFFFQIKSSRRSSFPFSEFRFRSTSASSRTCRSRSRATTPTSGSTSSIRGLRSGETVEAVTPPTRMQASSKSCKCFRGLSSEWYLVSLYCSPVLKVIVGCISSLLIG